MRKKEREVTDIAELESIISRSDVCRVAFADKDVPYIVTMNFGYMHGEHGSLYFHCANEGRKLEMIRKNNYVCFELDTDHEIKTGKLACDYGMKYSSIVGFGFVAKVNDNEEKIKGLNYIMEHYAGPGEFSYRTEMLSVTTVLRLDVTEMTGKRR
jgi:nitroimidazol reductase NimA-like FMN-containing flavoprotein (pyridoxamine 5'-phosphate oxidase superfamily)